MKNVLFIDFESAYDTEQKYGLRTLSIVQYVRDARFKAFGAGVCTLVSDPKWISAKDLPAWFKAWGERTPWSETAIVGHNVKFDGFILKEIFGVTPGEYIDTKGMSKAVLGKTIKGHSLQNISEHFGLAYNGVVGKGEMKTDGKRDLTAAEEADLAQYCLGDVDLDRQAFLKLAVDFPENQYPVLHRTVDMFVNPKLRLNVPLLQKTSIEEAARRTNIFTEIGIAKAEFASNVKFPRLLESRGFTVPMKPSPKKKNPDGTPLMIPALALGDIEFLEMLEGGSKDNLYDNEELRSLCEARVAAKSTLLETRSAKLAAIGATGLWPFDVEFSGADQTHRFSGGKGAGGNPQNFTRGSALRTAVEAPDGFELVVGDFANIELRIVAYLSRDAGLVQAIEQGTDLYCDFASVFFGRRVTKADKKERQFGKTAILGLGYGMGWAKFKRTVRLQTGLTISDDEAKRAVDLYRSRYSGVKELWSALDNTIQIMAAPGGMRKMANIPVSFEHECIVLPSGLKIRYPNLRQREGDRGMEWVYDAYNKGRIETRKLYGGKVLENISQAIAGDICKESAMQMDDNAVKTEPVTGLVHDEIHALAKKGLGLVVAMKLKRVMSIAPKWFPEIRLDAEVHVGPSWGSAK